MVMRGRKRARTITPTVKARNTIIKGSTRTGQVFHATIIPVP